MGDSKKQTRLQPVSERAEGYTHLERSTANSPREANILQSDFGSVGAGELRALMQLTDTSEDMLRKGYRNDRRHQRTNLVTTILVRLFQSVVS
jgi:hypothetical protein